MITRNEIALKLTGLKGKSSDEKIIGIKAFLNDGEVGQEDIEKILSDIESYKEFFE